VNQNEVIWKISVERLPGSAVGNPTASDVLLACWEQGASSTFRFCSRRKVNVAGVF
jgi:hypothetical protein